MSYKGFSLRFLLNYQFGGYTYGSFAAIGNTDGYSVMDTNQAIEQQYYWQSPGNIARNPKPLAGVSTGSARQSTRFLYHKDLIRLQNVVLSYELPKHLMRHWKLTGCTVSLIGDNLMAYSPYARSDRNSYKTMMNGYPLERTFSFSLNVGF